ncbi:MAG: hypothetical protein FWG70_08110 [Oscillospiraceae bacterium]|nr:hypothetical protein [Oscillospiraceae bacterium]
MMSQPPYKSILNLPKDLLQYGNALSATAKLQTALASGSIKSSAAIKTLSASVEGLSASQIKNIAIQNQNLIVSSMRDKQNITAYLQKRGLTKAEADHTALIVWKTKTRALICKQI